jgi:hypothetical protein
MLLDVGSYFERHVLGSAMGMYRAGVEEGVGRDQFELKPWDTGFF